ncbi:glycosyltransferase family 39 protein [Patulibacter sp. NPDC049589]|uniref:glycosyltransferase family 39 protein n=1 Tax=Patulibacter sp. NPDC049589 TaxID=3154731 RepID=UPI003425A092
MQAPGDRPGPPSPEDPATPPARDPAATDAGTTGAGPGAVAAPSEATGAPVAAGSGAGASRGAEDATGDPESSAPATDDAGRTGGTRAALVTAGSRRPWLVAIALVVLGGLVLRLWGIRWGLPYAYNLDERSHFVPRAVAYFQDSSLDPDYQLNPSGLIEWIAAALWIFKGGSDGVVKAWNTDPGAIWTIARVSSALLSTVAIGLMYAAGARLFDRRVGLLAAAILAFAFLPTHYGHLALNDGPSLAATALALFAIAGIVRYGRRRDYALAGAAVGLGFGLKYNTAFIALPLLTAAAIHALGWRPGDLRPGARGAYAPEDPKDVRARAATSGDGGLAAGTDGRRDDAGRRDAAASAGDATPAATTGAPDHATTTGPATATGLAARLPGARPAIIGLVLAGVLAVVCFFVMDPYAVLRPGFFRSEVEHLSDYTKGGLLLGETQRSGYRYYAWSLTWGFGVAPMLLCVVGGIRTLLRDRWQFLVLVPAPLIFLLYVGSQGRYFARYGMPVYPVLALLAAAGGVWLAALVLDRLRSSGRLRTALAGVAVLVVLGQGLVLVVHNDVVLTREDTRTEARDWMVQHIPARTTIVVEPMVPREWYADGAVVKAGSRQGYRWERLTRTGAEKQALIRKYPKLRSNIRRSADFANYGYTVFPGMLDFYRQKGACWIVSGSLQTGRVFNNPKRVPQAIKYYRALERQSDLMYESKPFDGAGSKNYFQYDMAFNFGQLRYDRPGPSMRVYRLHDCTPKVVPVQQDRRG